uniref:Uncharacterized protein n=1 Tax=Triticum urartu TaxID=4572 RepID=A0A8R7TD91_TRIUA
PPVGVRYLADKSADPPFEFTTDGPASPDEQLKWYHRHNRPELNLFLDTGPELNLVPLARPCTLQEYLVCCAGLPGGLKDYSNPERVRYVVCLFLDCVFLRSLN